MSYEAGFRDGLQWAITEIEATLKDYDHQLEEVQHWSPKRHLEHLKAVLADQKERSR